MKKDLVKLKLCVFVCVCVDMAACTIHKMLWHHVSCPLLLCLTVGLANKGSDPELVVKTDF